jgi:DUF1365 family protein
VESCLYEGVVRHRRLRPVANTFAKRLFMVYLDLDELPRVFRGRWLWSATRPAPVWFRRADHLGDPAVPLAQAVRDLVEARTGRRPAGPIRLLTNLRTVGYVFNPLSLFYCFDPAGGRVEAVVAEVSNTPWNERHCYVLAATDAEVGPVQRFETPKELHVSPFMGMRQTYRWTLRRPGRCSRCRSRTWRTELLSSRPRWSWAAARSAAGASPVRFGHPDDAQVVAAILHAWRLH